MPFIPTPPGVVRCRVSWTQGNAGAQNVFYVQTGLAGRVTTPDLENVIDQVAHSYNVGAGGNVLSVLSTLCFLRRIETEDAAFADGDTASRDFTLPGTSGHGTPCPPGAAVVIGLLTGGRGRSRRGRLYQMGIPESDVSEDGTLVAAAHADWVNAWSAFLVAIADATSIAAALSVVSFYSGVGAGGAPIPRGLAVVHPVLSVPVRAHTHSQRRRNLGG
jgi:hypothetical protein